THPQIIDSDLKKVKHSRSDTRNPVWIFPTESTDFGKIQGDLNDMISTVDKISNVPADSAAYHTGMSTVHLMSDVMIRNLLDATPYMYVSISNILFGCIWVAVIIGIFAVLKKKRDRLQSFEISDEN